MKKILTTLICLLFVLSLSSFVSAQIPQLQLQMPQTEIQQMQMGQTSQLGRSSLFEPQDTATQNNDNLGLSNVADADGLARGTTAQTSLCEDGSATIPSSCSVSDDLLAVECYSLRSLDTDTPRLVQLFIPGEEITYFRYFDSGSFLVASSDGLFKFGTMTGLAAEIFVSPLLPTDIKDYITVTSPISGLIMELILANDNSVYLRQGSATEFSLLISAEKELISIDYSAVNTKDLLWTLTDDGRILVADITTVTGSIAWTLALDISAELTSGPTAFVPAVGGFRVRVTTGSLLFSIVDETKEWTMLVSLALSGQGSSGDTAAAQKPSITVVRTTPPVWNACLTERPQRKTSECPEDLVAIEVDSISGTTIECFCEDGSTPIEEVIPGSNDVTYTCLEATAQECPEGLVWTEPVQGGDAVAGKGMCLCEDGSRPIVEKEAASNEVTYTCPEEEKIQQTACPDGSKPKLVPGSNEYVCPEEEEIDLECPDGSPPTLVDNEYKCIIEAECEEGSFLTTDASGEVYCLWPTSCPSGYTLTTLSDGSTACASPTLSSTPTALMVDTADPASVPIAEEATSSPAGSAIVRGGVFSCQMASSAGSSVDLFFLIAGLWGFVRLYARSRF